MQGQLFEPATFVLRPALTGPRGAAPFIVIGCGRNKRADAAPACDLYVSDKFRSSINIARLLGAPHAILSGKHGLVAGETVLEPYDVILADLPPAELRRWASRYSTSFGCAPKDAGSRC